mmetsp:Transcript_5578/g.16057  ORF Transcript_5578/g.16057 Transcript_5578/m.16057 type:complete len:559 (-) Transcript_5578:421-2097(-)
MTTLRLAFGFLRVLCALVLLGIFGSCTNLGGWSATADGSKASIPSQILRARMPFLAKPQNNGDDDDDDDDKQQLWMYEGALYDPLDGRQVANVQGLELVRPLYDTSHLAIDSLLRHPNATYVDAKTLWSQKIFCYTKPTTRTSAGFGNDASQSESGGEDILQSVRIRPRSPRKKVPLDQAVAVYETATTFVSRTKRGGRASDDTADDRSEDEDELLVHSERPNGQTMWGMAAQGGSQRQRAGNGSNNNNNNNNNMDFTVFAKLRNKHSPLYAPDLVPDPDDDKPRSKSNADGDVIVSPKRAALVQFGSSDKTMESKHKYGARETYSYRNIAPLPAAAVAPAGSQRRWSPLEWFRRIPGEYAKQFMGTARSSTSSSTSVHYTRYGEGPPFYAPGRMCMLELRGRPIGDLDEATPLLRGLLRRDGGPVANFHWAGDDPSVEDDAKTKTTTKKKKDVGSTTTTTTITNTMAIPSLQTAWNRKEPSTTYPTERMRTPTGAAARRGANSGRSTKHLLRLDVPDDFDGEEGAGKRLGAWTKKGKQRAEALWDRLKAATAMEAGS